MPDSVRLDRHAQDVSVHAALEVTELCCSTAIGTGLRFAADLRSIRRSESLVSVMPGGDPARAPTAKLLLTWLSKVCSLAQLLRSLAQGPRSTQAPVRSVAHSGFTATAAAGACSHSCGHNCAVPAAHLFVPGGARHRGNWPPA